MQTHLFLLKKLNFFGYPVKALDNYLNTDLPDPSHFANIEGAGYTRSSKTLIVGYIHNYALKYLSTFPLLSVCHCVLQTMK